MNIEQQCDRYRDELAKKEIPAYATIVPSRTTKSVVALHTRLSFAKNALAAQSRGRYPRDYSGGEIHQLVNGEWQLLYRVEQGATSLPWK